MEKLVWFFTNAGVTDVIGPLLMPLILALSLYQSHYPFVLVRALVRAVRGDRFTGLAPHERLPLLLVIPSLLRSAKERDAIQFSVASVLASGYPGSLVVCVSIDGTGGSSAALFGELEAWARAQALPQGVRLVVTGAEDRRGKGMAVDFGVRTVMHAIDDGSLDAPRPVVFFNMDADCELGPHALEIMVHELLRRGRFSGQRGLVVTSNVCVDPKHAWRGWRHFFSLEGQITLLVAREYRETLGLGRYNDFRVLPQLGASGALYCTWAALAEEAPHFARFIRELRWRDWLAWWLGAPPPHYRGATHEPLPEALAGMGDDTWMSFLACAARWDGERLRLDLPRTPLHALLYAVRSYVFRPFRYDPRATIWTESPTSAKALFKQRMRWNVSRIWTLQKWRLSLLYHLQLGLPALADVGLSVIFQSFLLIGLLTMPFAERPPPMWLSLAIVVEVFYFGVRTASTVLALWIDGTLWRSRHLLLALPMASVFHLAFAVASTVTGFVQLVFGHGLDDGFAPLDTHVRGGTGRIALGYRLRRAFALALRAVRHGDVPLGWFWLGWRETKWTHDGYHTLQARRPILKPRADAGSPKQVPAVREAARTAARAEAAREASRDEHADAGVSGEVPVVGRLRASDSHAA